MAKAGKKGGGGRRKKNGAGDDDFDKGPDGARRQRAAANDDERGEGDNSKNWEPSGDELDELFAVIDEEDAAIAKNNDANRLKNQAHRTAIAKGIKRLVQDGYPTKELSTLIREHRLKRKVSNIAKELDEDMTERFQKMQKAWADFRSMPLGQAAETRERAHADA